jgi:dipeptidyl aminopeptidase/acylaminoacyl peptidase
MESPALRFRTAVLALALLAAGSLASAQPQDVVERPAALTIDGAPPIPASLAAATRPYMEYRSAGFSGWSPRDRSMLIGTRFADTVQLHRVASPLAYREQLTFEADQVGGSWSPNGDVLVVSKDTGGSEFFQLYTLAGGRLTLLTDGRSRNSGPTWSHDGAFFGYTSTRRNGTDADLYVMDPRHPDSNRLVAQVQGGGWGFSDISPDGRTAVVAQYRQVTNVDLFRVDLATGRMTPIGDASRDIAYGGALYGADGRLWVTSDEGSDFKRLGTLDLATGAFHAVAPEARWDIETFDISDDGRTIAYVVNEAGISRLKLLDTRTGRVRAVTRLPAGVIGGVEIAPWGAVGLSLSSSQSPSDAYSVDPRTLAVTRWTRSETGGLDPTRNAAAELVTIRSFDGEEVSGFLYRPDATRFPGARPLIIDIHGGPEGQSRPGFRGRTNYLINKMGVAVFYPNVRGSEGYGKRFISLDNGPALRENSVRDIGAFLDALGRDPGIDARRIAVRGGSYGGYMCYASAIFYGPRLHSGHCTVAISSWVTFLENTQSYRRDLRRVEYGDERDPAQRAQLIAISPLTRVNEIRIPLLIETGANDPRVPASEADQIIRAVRRQGGTVWHMLGMNEGHGFAHKENQDYSFLLALTFWRQTLLGDTPAPAAAAPATR